MNPETAITLMLDIEHLSNEEKEWLHKLKNRIQCRIIQKYIKEQECSQKRSSRRVLLV